MFWVLSQLVFIIIRRLTGMTAIAETITIEIIKATARNVIQVIGSRIRRNTTPAITIGITVITGITIGLIAQMMIKKDNSIIYSQTVSFRGRFKLAVW